MPEPQAMQGQTMQSADADADPFSHLRGLDDPALIVYWAAVRTRLALTPKSSPDHAEIKRQYDDVADEYRRRMDGARP
jgi:hypothetical protein